MKADLKTKKQIAREVLLLFAVLILTGAVWGFLLLRNAYYNSKGITLANEVKSLTVQLDSLPQDKIKKLYEALNKSFVINYKVGKDEYSIPKEKEIEFLNDYRNAEKLPNDSNGYFYFRSADPLKILGKEAQYKKSSWAPPSDAKIELSKGFTEVEPYVFNFVDLETFRESMRRMDYRDKIYCCAEYDFGSRKLFEAKIDTALRYNKSIDNLKQQLISDKASKETSKRIMVASVWSRDEIWNFVFWTLLVTGIVIYPLRFSYITFQWAIKTIRK